MVRGLLLAITMLSVAGAGLDAVDGRLGACAADLARAGYTALLACILTSGIRHIRRTEPSQVQADPDRDGEAGPGPVLGQAAAILRLFAAPPAVADAELAIRGLCPVSVAYGTPETEEEQDLVWRQLGEIARECGTVAAVRGGNEHSTFVFSGADADVAAARFRVRVSRVAQSWWRVTPTVWPVRSR